MDAVLFDLDGTLIDTTSAILRSLQHTLWHFTGEKRDLDSFRQYIGIPLDDAMRVIVPSDPEAAREVYVRHNLGIHDELVRGFPGAVFTLKTLKENGIRLAVVTSKRRRTAQAGIDLAGLTGLFDAEVFFDDTERHKPDAEPILKALDLLGLWGGKALMVGDSVYDIRAAKNAALAQGSVRVKSAGAAYGPSGREILLQEQPDFIIDKLDELPAICGLSI